MIQSIIKMKKEITKILDNGRNEREVYCNLNVGDKLRCKKEIKSTGDIGASGLTFKYTAFIPGEIYEVYSNYMWGGTQVSYVLDEDNTLHFATTDLFEIVR